MSKEVIYKDLVAFHPGSYVEDVIDELNITQAEFAERLGTSSKTVSKIVNGEENISKDIANKLAKLTGISLKTWLNLQTQYDIKIMEIENLQNEDEERACRLIDFSYFKHNGFVEDKRYCLQDKIETLRKLFNISSLSWLFEFNSSVSYRNTRDFTEKSIVNSNIMLELAIDKARNATNVKYNKSKLKEAFPIIRQLALDPPEIFYPKLKNILLTCGIVLVGLPKLAGANLNGATKKFKNGSVLLLITDRNKYSDIFWFSLIHELGHIYYEDFGTNYENDERYKEKEIRADKFASDFFIQEEEYTSFIEENDFSEQAIKKLSRSLEILPSILVGRLQHDGFLEQKRYNYLKESYSVVISGN